MSGAIWISRWDEVAMIWSVAMWRSCWQGGLFALVVWIGCRLWRRVPAAISYALWWLVCLKLVVGLCPLFLTLPLLQPAPQILPVAAAPQVAPPRAASLQPTAAGDADPVLLLPTGLAGLQRDRSGARSGVR
jgi:hypothetical protein